MIKSNSFTKIDPSKFTVYEQEKIGKLSTSRYRAVNSRVRAPFYHLGELFLSPLRKGLFWAAVAASDGEEYGSGGTKKTHSKLKAACWLSLTAGTLPFVIAGLFMQRIFHPGSGSDRIQLVDATKDPKIDYAPPEIGSKDPLTMMSYNVAWTPSPADAFLDVGKAPPRARDFARWLRRQKELDETRREAGKRDRHHLPLFIGMQEAFDTKATKAFSDEVRDLYPYSITGAGWSNRSFFGLSSGLQFYSRLPIQSAAFYPFQDLEGLSAKTARGFLRIEVKLNERESALLYVTHTEAFEDPDHAAIRSNELTLLANRAKEDRKAFKRAEKKIRGCYLLGDLNVERIRFDPEGKKREGPQEPDGRDVEYWRHYGENQKGRKGPLHPEIAYDPFYEEHDLFTNERIKGTRPLYLESDVKNRERKNKGWKKIKEQTGTFYRGAYAKKSPGDYGTKEFYKGPQESLKNGRLDFVVELIDKPPSSRKKKRGRAEIRNVLPDPFKESSHPVSDHLPLQAIFYGKARLTK